MLRSLVTAATVATIFAFTLPAQADENIYGALSSAYERNSSLNSARAGLRATDENVPLAKSGYRPRVTGTAGITNSSNSLSGSGLGSTSTSFGIEIKQSIFDGFQTRSNVRAAQAGVRAERANLRNTEQNTLFDAAQAYMDVLQNRQIAALRAQNLNSLREQVRSERARFDVGEGTRTDVAQAQASLAGAQALLSAAQAQVISSEAIYAQIVGHAPGKLVFPKPLSKQLPKSIASAETMAFSNHPAIEVREALVDSGLFSVKAAEGAFYPQVGLSASVSQLTSDSGGAHRSGTSASIGLQLSVPIYSGGQASATVRQKKEQLGQAKINIDVARDQVRSAVISAFTQLEASRASVNANQEAVRAGQLALNGVVEERDVGQRTTLDVLNSRSGVLNAQIALVQAQRNLIVSSYALASAVGRLDATSLGLKVQRHDPEVHYEAVKDKWFGLRIPDEK